MEEWVVTIKDISHGGEMIRVEFIKSRTKGIDVTKKFLENFFLKLKSILGSAVQRNLK